MGKFESPDSSRHPGGAITDPAILAGRSVRSEVHIARCTFGSALAEINERCPAVRESRQQETAASNIARSRVSDSESQTDRYSRVDRIATRLQDRQADVGCVRFARSHHGVMRPRGFACAQARSGRQERRHERELWHKL